MSDKTVRYEVTILRTGNKYKVEDPENILPDEVSHIEWVVEQRFCPGCGLVLPAFPKQSKLPDIPPFWGEA